MRPADAVALLYVAAITAFFAFQTELFVSLTQRHPYPMGFAKIALLATFGECLRYRLAGGGWRPARLGWRFLIWGAFGVWFTAAFPFVDGGVRALGAGGLWPAAAAPLWMSVWVNLLCGFGFFMMFVHYWLDAVLAGGWCWPWAVLGRPQTARWARVVLISLVCFWVPAHTFTFWLPPEWRVLSAAYLAIALGLILSFAERRRAADTPA